MRQRNSYKDSLHHKGIEESLIYSDRDVVPHILIVGKNEGSDSTPQFPTIPAREEHLEHATDETRQTGARQFVQYSRGAVRPTSSDKFESVTPENIAFSTAYGLRRHKTEFNRSAQRLIFPSSRKTFLHLDKKIVIKD